MRETNQRPFGARCGDDPLWIILDNQHPCFDLPCTNILLNSSPSALANLNPCPEKPAAMTITS
ncbi:hypothetical protein [Aneurinibacillus aneurinilyticus]|uniref:hypothetical protein n=1 Tax=Aneurinibacillus aneurinilyticus TaxID=1391 RepID=UPI0035265EE5